MTWQFTLTGLLIGLLVGLTGMGGGALLTPILVIFFGFKPTYAVGTDILHGAVFKSFGAVRHRRLGNVHAHLTLWMFAGSGPMSLLGVSGGQSARSTRTATESSRRRAMRSAPPSCSVPPASLPRRSSSEGCSRAKQPSFCSARTRFAQS